MQPSPWHANGWPSLSPCQQDPTPTYISTLTDTTSAPVPGTTPRCYAIQVGALPSWKARAILTIASSALDVFEADDIEEWEDLETQTK
jgi:hypothetical protein